MKKDRAKDSIIKTIETAVGAVRRGSARAKAVAAGSEGVLSAGNAEHEERQRMIAEAAYFRAEQRGFAGGAELEDWLAAEKDMVGAAQSAYSRRDL